MKEPIIEFKNIEQAQSCLSEWQSRLFLTDWIINIGFEELNNRGAEINTEHTQKSAYIAFHQPVTEELKKRERVKYCAEKILVHELLHIIFDAPKPERFGIEQCEYEILQHQKTEFMARSLMMAKYGMTADWFKNACGGDSGG